MEFIKKMANRNSNSKRYRQQLVQLENNLQFSEESSLELVKRVADVNKLLESSEVRCRETLAMIASSELKIEGLCRAQSVTKRKLSDLYAQLISLASSNSVDTNPVPTSVAVRSKLEISSVQSSQAKLPLMWWRVFAYDSMFLTDSINDTTAFVRQQVNSKISKKFHGDVSSNVPLCRLALSGNCNDPNCRFEHNVSPASRTTSDKQDQLKLFGRTISRNILTVLTNKQRSLATSNINASSRKSFLGNAQRRYFDVEDRLSVGEMDVVFEQFDTWQEAISSLVLGSSKQEIAPPGTAVDVQLFRAIFLYLNTPSRQSTELTLVLLSVLKQYMEKVPMLHGCSAIWSTYLLLLQLLPDSHRFPNVLVYFQPIVAQFEHLPTLHIVLHSVCQGDYSSLPSLEQSTHHKYYSCICTLSAFYQKRQPELLIDLLCKHLKLPPMFLVPVDDGELLEECLDLPRSVSLALILLLLFTGNFYGDALFSLSKTGKFVLPKSVSARLQGQKSLVSGDDNSRHKELLFATLVKRWPEYLVGARAILSAALSEVCGLIGVFVQDRFLCTPAPVSAEETELEKELKVSLAISPSAQAIYWCTRAYLALTNSRYSTATESLLVSKFSPLQYPYIYSDWELMPAAAKESDSVRILQLLPILHQKNCEIGIKEILALEIPEDGELNEKLLFWNAINELRELACSNSDYSDECIALMQKWRILGRKNLLFSKENLEIFREKFTTSLAACNDPVNISLCSTVLLHLLSLFVMEVLDYEKKTVVLSKKNGHNITSNLELHSVSNSLVGLVFDLIEEMLVADRIAANFCWSSVSASPTITEYHRVLLTVLEIVDKHGCMNYSIASEFFIRSVISVPLSAELTYWFADWFARNLNGSKSNHFGLILCQIFNLSKDSINFLKSYPSPLLYYIGEALFWCEDSINFSRVLEMLHGCTDAQASYYLALLKELVAYFEGRRALTRLNEIFPISVDSSSAFLVETNVKFSMIPDSVCTKLFQYVDNSKSNNNNTSLDLARCVDKKDVEAFAELSSLHPLDLASFVVLSNSTSLQLLNLSQNYLKYLPSSICELTTLKRLDLSWNELTDLPEILAQRMTGLTVINISHNNFKRFPPVLSKLKNLVEIHVSHNNIEYLPADLSTSLPALRSLDISSNLIKSVPTALQKLKYFRI